MPPSMHTEKKGFGMSAKKLSNDELFHFCEQYSIILRSGISSVEGLRILSEDSATPEGKAFLEGLLEHMEMTGDFTETLEQSGVFPSSMISYVRLGEHTGCLDEVFSILTHYYEQEIAISSAIRSAVTYPMLMLGMMVAVIIILLVKVLPVFSQVFRQMGMEMTGISAGMLRFGQSLQRYSFVFIFLLVLVLAGIGFLIFHPKGKQTFNQFILRLPHFQKIPASMDYSRLSQGISMGLRSGLGPEDSMEMAQELITVPHVKQELAKAAEMIREGTSFAKALTGSGLFGGMEARLISIGFTTGSGDDVMQRLATRYQEESTNLIDEAISILEPTIVIVMTLLVGIVLLSVMMPLLGILSEMVL